MLLLRDDALESRRAATAPGAPLAPLFDSMAAELAPFLGHAPFIPEEKALLSRVGGRCESCGTRLEFDPWSPYRHRCPACNRVNTGRFHDRAWIMPYQLWLAERTVHASLFHALRGDARHAAFARDTLVAYAERYLAYPNVDNVLGPSRLFFSTYLESIWLLQVCVAADILRAAGDARTADIVSDRIIEPGAVLISRYDEGRSNRQVWNNAALLAAAGVLERRDAFDERVNGSSGLMSHLDDALLRDGTWYEGENYHQFALRGLWYGVTLAECAGIEFPRERRDRFQRAFGALFVTALPDFTMPSRKDSQYAVSLRQWRMADLTELGFARERQMLLAGALCRMYEAGHERRDTGRSRSTADVERNVASGQLTRADLGWRSLLHALPVLPELARVEPRSALLEHQGYAVFRRERDVYVGFEFGQSGGGHGHPDRLNLTLHEGAKRWLDDMGTGSYVDPTLFWFRSTLAHNAPLVNGRSQPLGDGRLLAYDEREGLGWIVAEFEVPGEKTRLRRTVVVAPDYLIEELSWYATDEIQVDIPWHLQPNESDAERGAILAGGPDAADGFAFISNVATVPGAALPPVFSGADNGVTLVMTCDREAQLYFADGPGQPPGTTRRFCVARARGPGGTFRAVLSWVGFRGTGDDGERAAGEEDALTISCREGERHVHRHDSSGWHVELFAGGARSTIDLAGFRSPAETIATPAVAPERSQGPRYDVPDDPTQPLRFTLGESHYRPSEQAWDEAGRPSAVVGMHAAAQTIQLAVVISAGDPVFAPADSVNPYDNEHADTMRAGIQLYIDDGEYPGAWMLVPEPNGKVRVRGIGDSDHPPPRASWQGRDDGSWEARIELPVRKREFALDLIVNETVRDRERRRGQLVLSGAHGEFAWLRGDRQDRSRYLPFAIGA